MPGIRLITTGGTIDADRYAPEPPETAQFTSGISRTVEFVKTLIASNELKTDQWQQKDSKDITLAGLKELAEKVDASEEDKVIITHGTDTLIDNAKIIQSLVKDKNKTIFFVGAMQPLANGKTSDGWKNLQFAVKDILKSRPGVYIIGKEKNRYGRFIAGKFNLDSVHKDYEEHLFVRDLKKER